MEEKKECTCCENKEQKPAELTDEETEKVAGGMIPKRCKVCRACGRLNSRLRIVCIRCGAKL